MLHEGGIMRAIRWSWILFCLGLIPAPSRANAPNAPAAVERYEVKLPFADFRAGAARTTVAAPLDDVLPLITDYAHYSESIKAFEVSKVVARDGANTDVYLRVKILKGAAKIWAVVRFGPPRTDGDSRTISAHLVKGNVKRLDAVWHLDPASDGHSRLALELLIIPDLPVPESLVVPEVRDAAGTAVRGVRDEAEKRASAK
jgi:ribosome-associated toxin RatA of RatAB toxin-antitoxin module